MAARRRAVLLCGSARTPLAAIARELARADTGLLIQAAPADLTDAQRLCRTIERGGGVARIVRGALGGESSSRALMAHAWRAARRVDAVVICPLVTTAGGVEPGLERWQEGMDVGLRTPFFLAKHAGGRMARAGGGQLVFAIQPPHRATALAAVVEQGLLAMVDALARALPRRLSVTTVVGDGRAPARAASAQLARAVRGFLGPDAPPRGALLELGAPARRG